MAGPPASNELRAKRVGHALINMTTEPWSQYYCCVLISSKEFVRQYPIATKRALRAIMKGVDICAAEPKRVARLLADKGLARYEYTLQTHQEIPYGRWRDYDIEDTVRFFALRMGELGLIKFTPQRIIAEGTDWRFLKCQEKNSRRDRPRKDNLTILHAADSLPVLLRCADCKPTIAAPVAQPTVSTSCGSSRLSATRRISVWIKCSFGDTGHL